jgi:hypothetical protein
MADSDIFCVECNAHFKDLSVDINRSDIWSVFEKCPVNIPKQKIDFKGTNCVVHVATSHILLYYLTQRFAHGL